MKKFFITMALVLSSIGLCVAQTYTISNTGWSINTSCTYEIKCIVTYTPAPGSGFIFTYSRSDKRTISPGQNAVFNVISYKGYYISDIRFSAKTGTISHYNFLMNNPDDPRVGNCHSASEPQYTLWQSYSANSANISSQIITNTKVAASSNSSFEEVNTEDIAKVINAVEIIEEPALVNIYPNPASSDFSFETNKSGIVSVYDATGKIMTQTSIEAGVSKIDILQFPTGIYHVVFTTNSEVKTLNLLKQ